MSGLVNASCAKLHADHANVIVELSPLRKVTNLGQDSFEDLLRREGASLESP